LLHDFACIHDYDGVRIPDGGQPMGNTDNRSVFGSLLDSHLDTPLTRRVKSRRCLVKNQNAWVTYQGLSKCNALALSAAEEGSLGPNRCPISILKSINE
jgi:hypothetical protein